VLFQKDFLVFIWIESHFEGLDHHLTYTILLALINLSQFISSLKVGAFLLMRCKGTSARLKIATQSERVWGILATSESDLKRLSDDIPGFRTCFIKPIGERPIDEHKSEGSPPPGPQ